MPAEPAQQGHKHRGFGHTGCLTRVTSVLTRTWHEDRVTAPINHTYIAKFSPKGPCLPTSNYQ